MLKTKIKLIVRLEITMAYPYVLYQRISFARKRLTDPGGRGRRPALSSEVETNIVKCLIAILVKHLSVTINQAMTGTMHF